MTKCSPVKDRNTPALACLQGCFFIIGRLYAIIGQFWLKIGRFSLIIGRSESMPPSLAETVFLSPVLKGNDFIYSRMYVVIFIEDCTAVW